MAALAANSDTGFTLPRGANTSRAFRIHVARTGLVKVNFRFSNVVNPNGRFKVTIRKLDAVDARRHARHQEPQPLRGRCRLLLDCYAARTVGPGTYIVRVTKLTVKAAPVELKMSWPS